MQVIDNKEFYIDYGLVKKAATDGGLASRILEQYLTFVAKDSALKANNDFHRHYAARLLAAIEKRPINEELN